MASNLTQRVAFAVVAIPAALGVVYLGGWPLVAVVSAAAVLGARELYDFARRQGVAPLTRFGLGSAALVPVLAYLGVSGSAAVAAWAWFLAALWMVALLTLTLVRRQPDQHPFAVSAATAFGVLYPAGLAAFLIPIRHGAFGPMSWAGAWLVFFPLVITWVCDTAAMFGGRAMGGPKLWPSVSPGKTWSGSLAGVAGALATVPVMNALVLERLGVALPLGQGLAFALALGILGQVGDLAESLYKREVGVKDSSALIPGHGGVLDRFDSLYFVLPVSAALYRLFGQL
ncbi:MAG: phosphatidate cytidylyltransferase [Gemmatimonadetes bacterium]|nr:phosphatidate cytidylyltransferase [Gemmatimonadota bacterium]MBK7713936.1 phosphatidate cytidylyltransferase [Gemmatimonadota bacterium]MBK7923936.1 phosphatidate cytidylyltransferase [Gemmatimonadota bacterium]